MPAGPITNGSPTSLKRWMADLPATLTSQPLHLLKIPGSHDSGATAELDPKLPVAIDLSDNIRRFAKPTCIKMGIKRWAVSQRYSIREQLEHGVRYLDLRIAHPPPEVRSSEKDFRIVHGLYGITLRDCLKQVADFLNENDKEVILFDMNHVYDINIAEFTIIRQEILEAFGKSWLCPYIEDINTVTLDYMWKSGYSSEKEPLRFFVSQGVITPQDSDVILRWFSSLQEFSKDVTPTVLQWMSELSEEIKQKINIVLLDYIDDHTSNFIISLNKA
nr:Phospholipase C domain containing protein [Haemonchus contortus]